MKFDEMNQRHNALIKDYCVSCNQPLPRGAVFCEHCGPPVLPGDLPETGMSLGKALKKIALLTVVFAILVAYKLEWDYKSFFNNAVQSVAEEESQEIPQDEDYQLFHYVRVPHANIREQPDKNSKVIAGAGKGERLVVVELGEEWTQVEVGGKKGWIASGLIAPTIE